MSNVEIGTIIAGRYRVERLVGRGAMGTVWAARHVQLDRAVALKLMEPGHAASADSRLRFEREAKAAAQIESPHVVQVSDYGVDADRPYIVRELLRGEDLSQRLRRVRRLSLADTAAIVTQVSKALSCAHEAGIVHRDLKPANVFLAQQHHDEIVKVLDFGIAKATGCAGDATRTGVVIGTPHYMSPEQARSSKHVDPRSDLWSLGVIAFRCLTGSLPFPGDELTAILVAICTEPIPIASRLLPQLGPEVDRFFARALARQLDQRFQSAPELAEAFARLAAGPAAATSPNMSPKAEPAPGEAHATARLAPGTLSPTGSTLSPKTVGRQVAIWSVATGALAIAVASFLVLHWWGARSEGALLDAKTMTTSVVTGAFAQIPVPVTQPPPAESGALDDRKPLQPPGPADAGPASNDGGSGAVRRHPPIPTLDPRNPPPGF
jgi:serine/threonine-protein kinase